MRKLGRYDEAAAALEKALLLDSKNADAWRAHALVCSQLDRNAEAAKSSEKALALDPNNARTWIVRGFALHRLGQYEKAVESYARAIELNPMARTAEGPGITGALLWITCLGMRRLSRAMRRRS